jgi:putative endonuclease
MNLKLHKQFKGIQAEKSAEAFLQKQGLTLIERNYRNKLGEIDLIMHENEILVFIEVRYRENSEYGSGIESVTYHKQQKIIKAAQYYLQVHQLTEKVQCRFDVIGIGKDHSQVEWVKNAFE